MHPDRDTDDDADTDTDMGTIGPIIRVRVWFLWQLFKSLASASLQLCLANKLFAYLTQIVAHTQERGGVSRKCGRGIISTAAFNENVAKVSATKCCLANVTASFAALAAHAAVASASAAAAATATAAGCGRKSKFAALQLPVSCLLA